MTSKYKVILFIVFMIVMVPGLFVFFSWYLGMFDQVQMRSYSLAKSKVVYTLHKGDYRKSGKSLGLVIKFLEKENIACEPIMVYLDDDTKVIKKKLRSQAGCRVSQLPKRLPDSMNKREIEISSGQAFFTNAHPSVAIKKVTDKMRIYYQQKNKVLKFPVVSFPLDRSMYFISSNGK